MRLRLPRFLVALPAAALLLVTVWSCRIENSTGVATSAPQVSAGLVGNLVGTLVQCSPLPYAQNSKVIGPAGGDLQIGPHVLHVPAGALSQSVLITGQAPTAYVNSVQLSPQGLQFAAGKPASLTLSYANCNLLGSLAPKRVAYTTDGLQIISYLPSIDNLLSKQVTGQIQHFSRYAVAW